MNRALGITLVALAAGLAAHGPALGGEPPAGPIPAGSSAASVAAPAPAAPAASADVARAQAKFAEGEAAFSRGDFLAAAQAFDAAFAADPNPTSLFNAARSWERAGETVRAANLYRRFLRDAPGDTPYRERATASLAELGRRLGRIEIVGAELARPSVDGAAIDGNVTYVSPGSHRVEGDVRGGHASERVTLSADQTLTVALEPPRPEPRDPLPPGPRPAAPQPAAPARGGVTPWILLPFGAATAALGVTLIWSGVDTLVARDQYLQLSEEAKVEFYPDGKFAQDRTNVLIGVTAGMAVVTGAIALFAVDFGHGTVVGLGPSEARVVVRF